MEGNPTEFRHRALTCARLALASPIPDTRRAYAKLAASWQRLASELESRPRHADSSAARAGIRFAAAWFSLCRFEETSSLPQQSGRKIEMPIILWLLGVPLVVIVLLYLLNIV